MSTPTPPTVQKVAQMQAAGYSIGQHKAHCAQLLWQWTSPSAGGSHLSTSEKAWTEAERWFDREIERARELMKHLDLKAAAKTFFEAANTDVDWDYFSDGGSTWMVDATFEPDELITALIAAPQRDQI